MQKWLRSERAHLWLAIVGVATLILGAAYAMAQQSTRLAADDLPLQTAQTVKHQLARGATAQDVTPLVKTDLRTDSTIFIIITDVNHNVLASSASLDGKTPLPPMGVFDYASMHGSDHFSWEPSDNVRLTTQVLPYSSGKAGFIITGQSLAMAEDRINTYGELALAAWLAVVAWVTLVLFFLKPVV